MAQPSLQALADLVEKQQLAEVGLAPLERPDTQNHPRMKGYSDLPLGDQMVSRVTGPRFDVNEEMRNPYTNAPLRSEPIFGGAGRVSEMYSTPKDAMVVRNPFIEENLTSLEQKQSAAEIREIQKRLTDNKRIEAQDMFGAQWRAAKWAKANLPLTPAQRQQIDAAMQQQLESFDMTNPLELFEVATAQADPKVQMAKVREGIRHTTQSRFGDSDFANMMADYVETNPTTGEIGLSKTGLQLYQMREDQYREQQKIENEFQKDKRYRYTELSDFLSDLDDDDDDGHAVYLLKLKSYMEDFGTIPGAEPNREGGFNKVEEMKFLSSGRNRPTASARPQLQPNRVTGVRDITNAADLEAARGEVSAARKRGDMKFKIIARDPATGRIVTIK